MDSGWAVQTPNEPGPIYFECHPLQYFLYPTDPKDEVQSQIVGGINGFTIYDVVHTVPPGDDGDVFHVGDPADAFPQGSMKMIVVERKPGEFCEIFYEYDEGDPDGHLAVVSVNPSYILHFDSDTVLATDDYFTGNAALRDEAYWTFDKDGPILLDLSIIDKAVENLVQKLPGGPEPAQVDGYGGLFDIYRLTFGPLGWERNGTPDHGNVCIQFALKDHQLQVISQTVDAESQPGVRNNPLRSLPSPYICKGARVLGN